MRIKIKISHFLALIRIEDIVHRLEYFMLHIFYFFTFSLLYLSKEVPQNVKMNIFRVCVTSGEN